MNTKNIQFASVLFAFCGCADMTIAPHNELSDTTPQIKFSDDSGQHCTSMTKIEERKVSHLRRAQLAKEVHQIGKNFDIIVSQKLNGASLNHEHSESDLEDGLELFKLTKSYNNGIVLTDFLVTKMSTKVHPNALLENKFIKVHGPVIGSGLTFQIRQKTRSMNIEQQTQEMFTPQPLLTQTKTVTWINSSQSITLLEPNG